MKRRCCLCVLAGLSLAARSHLKLGDNEWTRRFTRFMKELNEFIILLNENKVDPQKWERVRAAWNAIEAE